MSIVKRAIFYVSRKWQQSLIIFFVLLIVCSSALIGLAVLRATDSAAANLRRQLGGTFSMEIDRSNPENMQNAEFSDQYTASYYVGEYLDNNVIDEVMKTSGISDYSAYTYLVANLKSGDGAYHNLVENTQNPNASYNPHMTQIHGWSSLRQCAYFANHLLEVTKGKMFTADGAGQAVISRELAQLNQIDLGDKLILEVNREVTGFAIPSDKQERVVEVVGIFDFCQKQQIDQFTSQRQMLQNWVFVDAQTVLSYTNEISTAMGERPVGYDKVTFRVTDPAEMDSIVKDIQENKALNWSCFKIEIDNTNYQSAQNALEGMNHGVRIMILAITAAGVAVLILLLSIWAKSRVYETGILLSLGKGKWEILAQRIAEIIFITVLAFGLSYVCSNAAANNVGNILLAQANEQNTEEKTTDSIYSDLQFSSDNLDLSPVFSAPKIEELSVSISADVFAVVLMIELSIVLCSVCIASIPLMSVKPKAILTKYE